MRRSAALAGAGTLVAIAVALAVVLSSSSRHAIASNYIRPITFISNVDAGERVCQPDQDVPAGTGGVALRVGTFGKPGPRLELAIRERGRTIATGTRQAGWKEGDVAISVPELATRHEVTEVCVRNDGSETIAVAGGSGSGAGAEVGGKPAAGAIRLTFLEPDKRSWYAFAPK